MDKLKNLVFKNYFENSNDYTILKDSSKLLNLLKEHCPRLNDFNELVVVYFKESISDFILDNGEVYRLAVQFNYSNMPTNIEEESNRLLQEIFPDVVSFYGDLYLYECLGSVDEYLKEKSKEVTLSFYGNVPVAYIDTEFDIFILYYNGNLTKLTTNGGFDLKDLVSQLVNSGLLSKSYINNPNIIGGLYENVRIEKYALDSINVLDFVNEINNNSVIHLRRLRDYLSWTEIREYLVSTLFNRVTIIELKDRLEFGNPFFENYTLNTKFKALVENILKQKFGIDKVVWDSNCIIKKDYQDLRTYEDEMNEILD